jgi:hypothetical protein
VIDQITSIFLQLYCTSNYMKTDIYLVCFIFKRESRSEKIQMRCITESHCTYQDALKKEKKKVVTNHYDISQSTFVNFYEVDKFE